MSLQAPMTTVNLLKMLYFNYDCVYMMCMEGAYGPYIWRSEDTLWGVCSLFTFIWVPEI